MSCDWDVSVRIVASDGVTTVLDFNDDSIGLEVVSYQEPEDATEKRREIADGVDGDYAVSERDAAGDLVLVTRVTGATWAECASRWQVARAAYRAESHYYVDTVVEGVTTRYRTNRPDSVQAGEVDLFAMNQTYSIRWHVQPNPTVTA